MSVIHSVQIGVPHDLALNVVYAMPALATIGFADLEDHNLQVSMTPTGTWLNLSDGVGSEGTFFTAAPFIRTATVAGVTILLKRRALAV